MPIIKSAVKRMKQTAVRRERNVALKREIKSATKSFMDKPSAETLSAAQSKIDTAVKKNVLNKTTAGHRKAKLSAVAKDAGVKLPAKKATKALATTAAKKPAAKKTTATAAKKPAAKAEAKPAAKKPATTAAKKPAAKKAPTKKA